MTLFHEFRHALQHHRPHDAQYRLDPAADPAEDDARAWSLSLFHQVRPQLLATAIETGGVFYITSLDVTCPTECLPPPVGHDPQGDPG